MSCVPPNNARETIPLSPFIRGGPPNFPLGLSHFYYQSRLVSQLQNVLLRSRGSLPLNFDCHGVSALRVLEFSGSQCFGRRCNMTQCACNRPSGRATLWKDSCCGWWRGALAELMRTSSGHSKALLLTQH